MCTCPTLTAKARARNAARVVASQAACTWFAPNTRVWATQPPPANTASSGLPAGTACIGNSPGTQPNATASDCRFRSQCQPVPVRRVVGPFAGKWRRRTQAEPEHAVFNASQMSANRDALAPLVRGPGASRKDACLLAMAQASVFSWRAKPSEADEAGQCALALAQQVTPAFEAQQRQFMRHSLSLWWAQGDQLQHALQAARDINGQYPIATAYKLAAIDAYPTKSHFTACREREGHLLQKMGRCIESNQTNVRLLPVARHHVQAMHAEAELCRWQSNMAQSHRTRGQPLQSRQCAQAGLKAAQTHQRTDSAHDARVHLVVLARESNTPSEAPSLRNDDTLALTQGDSQVQSHLAHLRSAGLRAMRQAQRMCAPRHSTLLSKSSP